MDHRERWHLLYGFEGIMDAERVFRRLNDCLSQFRTSDAEYLPLLLALDQFSSATKLVDQALQFLLDSNTRPEKRVRFSVQEQKQLQALNRNLSEVSKFMHATADAIRPELLAKVADLDDPMVDFEIEATIDYELHEDDSEYSEDVDNYLSTREEYLTRSRERRKLDSDWSDSFTPDFLRKEPLCRLLHELTEHRSGFDGPRVSMRDCLRLGSVFVDIKVRYQYHFDLIGGKWVRQWNAV